MAKRNYRANLDFIAEAFTASLENAEELVSAAKALGDSGHHATMLSLSVLALEELGKLFCIDGLLFARADDFKAKTFSKALKSHSVKLNAVELLPLLMLNIARTDPRYESEGRFKKALNVSAIDLNARGNTVLELLAGNGFQRLDEWKQFGFYSQPRGDTFVKPSVAVSKEISEAVYMLAWRSVTTLSFLFKEEGLKRYIGHAVEIRARLSEADHMKLQEEAANTVDDLFRRCPARS